MTPKARRPLFERLKSGMEEGIRHARGEAGLTTTIVELPDPPPEVCGDEVILLRSENRLSQAAFARLMNVSTRTVRSWEQGHRKPSQAALRLLQVLRLQPDGVLRAAGLSVGAEGTAGDRRRSRKTPGTRTKATARVGSS
jgi:putative transcriptional regulator